ncbi:inositol monophosphatase family protein [Amycolatopsis sp. WQ 127309]|uniref:inositol monophosphatase family protein n=1 Tax=Amycolatopsis sp. WQ 127309 TaxID=2932773 RepID=UPI001FF4BEA7|nr:inositol monophosphatase family protein [Amycolatopsis sp. WQ 127309]UOZ07497.1 inositol monophosphatase [Amycolatopsis sp. WQ 127309]
MKALKELLAVAQEAVAIGSKLMLKDGPGGVHLKGDRDLVTDMDIKIQEQVRTFLEEKTPDFNFLGEEQGGGSVDESEEFVWALDPIDGTSNFAHRIPLCASQLALIHRGEPVIGVITAPFLGLNYYGSKGGGSFCNGEPINSSSVTEIDRAIVSIGDYATGSGAAKKNERRFAVTRMLAEQVERVRMWGSAALDLAFVADGRTDACVILANKPWDTAAGVLIAREAGALVVDATGVRHDFSSTATIATAPGLELALLDRLR